MGSESRPAVPDFYVDGVRVAFNAMGLTVGFTRSAPDAADEVVVHVRMTPNLVRLMIPMLQNALVGVQQEQAGFQDLIRQEQSDLQSRYG